MRDGRLRSSVLFTVGVYIEEALRHPFLLGEAAHAVNVSFEISAVQKLGKYSFGRNAGARRMRMR